MSETKITQNYGSLISIARFRFSTLFWITLVVVAFFAGRYSDMFMFGPTTNKASIVSTWNSNYSVPIAIAGQIDLDGDGEQDVDELMRLIRSNGGMVVAFEDKAGVIHGEIDANTRYIVIDDKLTGPSANNRLLLDAQRNSVPQINITEFLKKMGVNNMVMADQGFKPRN